MAVVALRDVRGHPAFVLRCQLTVVVKNEIVFGYVHEGSQR